MGLKLTLNKEYNTQYNEYVDAYWCIEDIIHTTEGNTVFHLYAYPSRVAKYKNMSTDIQSLGYGGAILPLFETRLYEWQGLAKTADVFPNGIPLDKNTQLTAIYNWVKSYTQLPFEDVLEDESEE